VGVDFDPVTNKAVSGDVWWITPEGVLGALPPLTEPQLPPLNDTQNATKNLHLIPADDGSPWLWTGKAWFRFDPWQKTFVVPPSAPLDGPDSDLPIIAVDPGLMVWLQREPDADGGGLVTRVRGFRHGVRGPLVRDTTFLLNEQDPQHLVPNGVAITECGEDLVNPNHARLRPSG